MHYKLTYVKYETNNRRITHLTAYLIHYFPNKKARYKSQKAISYSPKKLIKTHFLELIPDAYFFLFFNTLLCFV